MIPAKTPYLLTKIYPDRIWSKPETENKIYLTFDDGPIPELTPWVLEQLEKFGAKASFFCIGDNIRKYPKIFKKIIAEQHQIGNHTYNHLNGWKTSSEEYLRNVILAEEIIKRERRNAKKGQSKLFRPPYGRIKSKQVKMLQEQNFEIVMWDILSLDYQQKISAEKCYQNVTKNAVPGSIIVFHDSLKAEKNLKVALPLVLAFFRDNNFSFGLL